MERRKIVAGFLVVTVLLALAACGSTGGGKRSGPQPTQRTDLLDEKGAALGISTPVWVTTYMDGGSNLAVEALPEYKDFYCFVADGISTDKAFLLAWVNNLRGPAVIASTIATSVSEDVAARAGNIEGAERERIIRTNSEVMTNASYIGARKVSDWWLLARNRATKEEYYQAFVLYIIDKKVLNDQIARNLQNIADNNAAISEAERAIYADLISEIRTNGFSNR
jgi:hypothetical protein